jgi:Gram-negative bacterial TonB protein C-terminal
MKNFTLMTMLCLLAFTSKAQKSALTPTTFSAKDKALIASVLDIDRDESNLEDKDKARAMRFKNMTVDRDSTYYDVETPASFPDGQDGLKKFIGQNIVRPKNSKGETVLVRFMVERYGEISKVHVIAGPANSDAALSAEAMKVVKKMGSWNPAKIQGIEVASYYVLPIKF